MAPKLVPRKLGSVVANKRRFRAQVILNRTVQAGPLRARHADAVADLALVRSCQARVEIPALLARLRTGAGRAPAKLSPGELGTVVANRRRFRAQVKLQGKVAAGPSRARAADAGADLAMLRACRTRGEISDELDRQKRANNDRVKACVSGKLGNIASNKRRFRAQVWLNGAVQAGPLRPRAVDAKADLAMVRACPTRDAIPAVLSRLRAEAARTPGRLPLAKLGTVTLNRNRFRVQVVLNGLVASGPLRTREEDADADLALVRLCPARGDIPALLASLRAKAAVGTAPRDSSSRPSGAASMRYSRPPRNIERAFPALFARLRAECGGA